MAGDKIPSVHHLDKPEKLQDLLKEDRGDDCLSCRIVGKSRSHNADPTHPDYIGTRGLRRATFSFRRRCLPWSGGVQLLLWSGSA